MSKYDRNNPDGYRNDPDDCFHHEIDSKGMCKACGTTVDDPLFLDDPAWMTDDGNLWSKS